MVGPALTPLPAYNARVGSTAYCLQIFAGVTRLVGIQGAFHIGSGARVSPGTLLLWKSKADGRILQYDIGPHTGKCIFSQH